MTQVMSPKLCECGCGKPAAIAKRTRPYLGVVKGQPTRFAIGHANRKGWFVDLFAANGCWELVGPKKLGPGGYGQLEDHTYAHRVVYQAYEGPIPEGMQLDHLCRNRRCVNPDHLEPVTGVENIRRGKAAKLTVDQVREIRASVEQTSLLARRFGVDRTNIQAIRRGQTWKGIGAA